jgi:hypothetical protein
MCSCIKCLCNNKPTFTSHFKIRLHNQEFSTIEKATYLFMINNTNFCMNHTCVMSLVLFSYYVPKKFTMDESNTILQFFDFGQPTLASFSYKLYSTMDCSKLAICLLYKCFFINMMPWKTLYFVKGWNYNPLIITIIRGVRLTLSCSTKRTTLTSLLY